MIALRFHYGFRRLLVTLLLCLAAGLAQAEAPRLKVVSTPSGARIGWTNVAPGYLLEIATELVEPTAWSLVAVPAVDTVKETSLAIDFAGRARFYRLREASAAALATVAGISPSDREPGVSVNREIVLDFSLPLAADTAVTTTNFFAGLNGRKFLSRVELSSDRRKASLFFLEPQPAGARVNVVFDGSGLRDVFGRPFDADGDGLAGGLKVFSYDTFSATPIVGTAVIGRVFASELTPGPDTGTNAVNQPLGGVTITVDGAEESLRAVTDANGFFKLTNAPAGRFFVHIDGRTSPLSHWPEADYYPFVGKAWEAVPGREDNLAGGSGLIYLPRISADTLRPVSATQDTPIAFPESVVAKNPALAGVTLVVPAGALFDDNGNRGGKVGIAPVPPDRLPGPLPGGLNPPLVITVQTDGAQNFDRPAPICFPNVPNAHGFTPTPGMKAALVSFDHDTGEWGVVGSMTVSDDGRFICTDPGVGILKPGWHGTDVPDPNQNPGPPPPPNPNPPPDPNSPPPPPNGPPPPCDDSSDCPAQCDESADHIINEAQMNYAECIMEARQISGDRSIVQNALEVCDEDYREAVRDANALRRLCKENCPDPCPSGSGERSAPRRRSPVRANEDQFATFFDKVQQAVELLRPHFGSADPVPATVQAAADRLLEEAQQLAGNDVQGLIRLRRLALEFENVTRHQALGEDYGYQPNRPMFLKVEYRRQEIFVDCVGGTVPTETVANLTTNIMRFPSRPKGQYVVYLDGISRDQYERSRALNDGPGHCRFNHYVLAELIRVQAYDPVAHVIGEAFPRRVDSLRSGISGFSVKPLFAFQSDRDHDGLPDEAEAIVGTDPDRADSDGDQVADGAELDQGSNPLDGRPAAVGIQATIKGGGTAYDVAAFNEVSITAEGPAGVSLFDVTRGYNPVYVGTLATPGDARAVALGNGFAAVGGGSGGLSLVGLGTHAAGTLLHTVAFSAPVGAVAAQGGTAFAGTDSGEVIMLEALSGVIIGRAQVGQRVHDLGFSDGHLFVLTDGTLAVFRVDDAGLTPVASVSHGNGFPVESLTNRRRLAVGDGLAWVTGYPGYTTLSVTNPAAPVVLGAAQDYGPNSFKQIAPTGSGYGVATVGRVPTNPDPKTHNVQLFNLRAPAVTTNVLTQYDTPGLARAVALYAGLAYVADSEAGLELLTYLPFDTGTNPPTIRLRASTTAPLLEAGRTLGLIATVTDDVQVREVEFYLNGQRVLVDGGFPFEVGVRLPGFDTNHTNVTLRARAIDTGGNAAWSEELHFGLAADLTPPVASLVTPKAGGLAGDIQTVGVGFNEPVNLDSLGGRLAVLGVGPDGVLGTVDDLAVPATLSLRNEGRTAYLAFGGSLPAGRYTVKLAAGVTDASGNATTNALAWNFRALDGADLDQDGLLDAFEQKYGYDPSNPDQTGNGIPDGLEDDDGDGVPNYVEMLLGLDPHNAFTFPPTRDDQLDRDGDHLTDVREVMLGTDWLRADTDGDLFTDDAEVLVGTDPLNPRSYPHGVRLTQPAVQTLLQKAASGRGLFVFGHPQVETVHPSSGAGRRPFILSQPPLETLFIFTAGRRPFIYGRPSVEAVTGSMTGRTPFILGRPPVEVGSE